MPSEFIDLGPASGAKAGTQFVDLGPAPEVERPGFISRTLKQAWNSGVAGPIEAIRTKSNFGQATIQADVLDQLKKRRLAGLPEPTQAEVNAMYETATAKAAGGAPVAQVPPAQTIPETVANVAGGLGGFMGKLAIAKQGLGTTSMPVAFEAVGQVSGDTPGSGAAMGAVFGGLEAIPAATTLGKTAKVVAEAGAMGGLAKLEGASNQEAVVQALVPVGMRGWAAYKEAKARHANLATQEAAFTEPAITEAIRAGLDPDAAAQAVQEVVQKHGGVAEASKNPDLFEKDLQEGVARRVAQQETPGVDPAVAAATAGTYNSNISQTTIREGKKSVTRIRWEATSKDGVYTTGEVDNPVAAELAAREWANSTAKSAPVAPEVVARDAEFTPTVEQTPSIPEQGMGGVSESLWHETGPSNIGIATEIAREAAGMNVATVPELALGQKGKGVLLEWDKNKVLGSRGFTTPIKKPATGALEGQELRIGSGLIGEHALKSITIKSGVKLPKVESERLGVYVKRGQMTREVLPDGSIKYTKISAPVAPEPTAEVTAVRLGENPAEVPMIQPDGTLRNEPPARPAKPVAPPVAEQNPVRVAGTEPSQAAEGVAAQMPKSERPAVAKLVSYTPGSSTATHEQARAMIAADFEQAYRIGMGQKEMPAGQEPFAAAMYSELADHAWRTGNVELQRSLATHSSIPYDASAKGQYIQALAMETGSDPLNPVNAIRDTGKTRTARLEERTSPEAVKQRKTKSLASMDEQLKKSRAPKSAWNNFIASIQC